MIRFEDIGALVYIYPVECFIVIRLLSQHGVPNNHESDGMGNED